MKIYIVIEAYPYEGSDIIGVFATNEEAEQYIKKRKAADSYPLFSYEEWALGETKGD